jgi:hypothetical protein
LPLIFSCILPFLTVSSKFHWPGGFLLRTTNCLPSLSSELGWLLLDWWLGMTDGKDYVAGAWEIINSLSPPPSLCLSDTLLLRFSIWKIFDAVICIYTLKLESLDYSEFCAEAPRH